MRGKFLQDIYLEYFVIFGASWLDFGTDATQPSQSFTALVIFVRYTCKCQKMAALKKELFPCNHSNNVILTDFISTRERIQLKFKAKSSTYDRNRNSMPLKLEKRKKSTVLQHYFAFTLSKLVKYVMVS